MNANELAEIQAFKTEELTMWERNHTATMLRQQQAEIESLKNRNWDLVSEPWGFDRKPADLTDEEIDELANKYLYVLNDVPYANDIKDFARAILRKAQGE